MASIPAVRPMRHARDISKQNGYRVLRFWNNDVCENISGVLAAIDTVINADRPPTPDPSPPQAGEGRRVSARRAVLAKSATDA